MDLAVERIEAENDAGPAIRDVRGHRIDVTDMDARRVQEFARENVDTDRISLEHRAGRTYLVVGR